MNIKDEDLWILTPEQKAKVYEQEKERLERDGPMLSTKQKCWIGVYVLGVLFLRFGVPDTLIHFYGEQEWEYLPRENQFGELMELGVFLVRPLLAVLVVMWGIGFPIAIVWGVGEFIIWAPIRCIRDWYLDR